jgi:malate dehydrogenase (oxaloacetate-decarboxylating)(NADP+)
MSESSTCPFQQGNLPLHQLGTNNPKNLEDPLYLGLRQQRIGDAEMDAFMDEFMEAMAEVFPKILIQFEDFSTEHAFHYLERYRKGAKVPVFNDDIQGTGAVRLFSHITGHFPSAF